MNRSDPGQARRDLLVARAAAQRLALAADLQRLSARVSGVTGLVSAAKIAPLRGVITIVRRHPWLVATAAQVAASAWRSRAARWVALAAVIGGGWLARSERAERSPD
jgi:hypothetical protein